MHQGSFFLSNTLMCSSLLFPFFENSRAPPRANDPLLCFLYQIFGTVFPLWGLLIQLAALVLFDVGCAAHLSVEHKRRGPGYWCAFTAVLLRAVIAFMHLFLAKSSQASHIMCCFKHYTRFSASQHDFFLMFA